MYLPSHRQAGTQIINILSTLRTVHDLCKNISLAVLYGNNRNTYTVSTQSGVCMYTYYLQNRDAGRAKEIKKNWDSSEGRVPRISSRAPFWARGPYVLQLWPSGLNRPCLQSTGNHTRTTWRHDL